MTTFIPLPPIGTIVTIDDPRCPGPYKVTNHGPKNATLVPCDPDGKARPGRGARFPGWMLSVYDPAHPDGPYLAPLAPPTPVLDPGVLVTSATRPGVFVVLADKVTKVNVAALGGDNGRYFRIPPAALTVVPLAELAKHLGGVQ
jgi:hypothetical protein